MDVSRLLALFAEEIEDAERGTWYGGGSDVASEALLALLVVIKRVQYRLEEEN